MNKKGTLVPAGSTDLLDPRTLDRLPPILLKHGTLAVQQKVSQFYLSIANIFERWVTRRDSPHTQRAYRLTLLKKTSQSTKVNKIKAATQDLRTIREIFLKVEPVVQSLDLSHDGVQYYANSVIKSRVFQVSRRAEEDRHLHLICFVAHQYRRAQDTLVDVFLQVTQNTVNVCKREHKEKYYEERVERRRSLKSFVDSVHVRKWHRMTASPVLGLFMQKHPSLCRNTHCFVQGVS
jgi:hypothetical protein